MGHIACSHCGLVPQCRCRDHQIHAVMADFCAQTPSDVRFLDANVENPDGKKSSHSVEPSLQNNRKLPVSRNLQSDSALNLTHRDDACKELSPDLPRTRSATPDARSGCCNTDITSVSLTYFQKVTSRGLACARSISRPGNDNR